MLPRGCAVPFDHLVLMITDHCPLQCAHCCVESGPRRMTTMAQADAISYVRQAHAMNPQTVLSFTGGEPFVRYPLMRAIAREAHALGMIHTVVTSAVWCKSREFARGRLAELQALGLRALSVSYDAFHEPWTTPEQVEHCIAAGVELGLKVVAGGAVTRTSKGAREMLGERAACYPTVGWGDAPVAPAGRAALIPLESLLMTDWGDAGLAESVCPIPSDLYVQPDGSVYPCCTTGGDYDFLRLGNARETPLAELRARLERGAWFRIITQGGFAALEAVVQRYDPGTRLPRRYVNVCHLCQLVFGAGELGTRVRDALARHDAAEAVSAQVSQALWARLCDALEVRS